MKQQLSWLSVWLAPIGINVLIGSCLIAALLADGLVDLIATATIAIGCTVAFVISPTRRGSRSHRLH